MLQNYYKPFVKFVQGCPIFLNNWKGGHPVTKKDYRFVKWITIKGRKIYASAYGLKAFKIPAR